MTFKAIGQSAQAPSPERQSGDGMQHGASTATTQLRELSVPELRPVATPTPRHGRSLSPQGRQDHRASIAFECKVFFVAANYWRGNEGAEVESAVLAWWCDELEDWTKEQIVYAMRKFNRDNPRIKATPGDILAIMTKLRGSREAERMRAIPKPEEPKRDPVTAERAAEIMREVYGE